MAEAAKPFTGYNFQAALKDLEGRMRNAAANLEFEGEGTSLALDRTPACATTRRAARSLRSSA